MKTVIHPINQVFKDDVHRRSPEPAEFHDVGEDILQSADLTEKLYSCFMDLMVNGWTADAGSAELRHVGAMYVHGLYLPCVKRLSFTREVDLLNDGVPGIRTLATYDTGQGWEYHVIFPEKPPHGLRPMWPHQSIGTYRHVTMYKRDKVLRSDPARRIASEDLGELTGNFISISRDGRAVPLLGFDPKHAHRSAYAVYAFWFSLVANAWADRKHLWSVETEEEVLGRGTKARLLLGVTESHVQSLFYARQLPRTDSGRRRPILHWVEAHQRRIKEGVEVDVRQHMRGIEQFEMDNLAFRITTPSKEQVREMDAQSVAEMVRRYRAASSPHPEMR